MAGGILGLMWDTDMINTWGCDEDMTDMTVQEEKDV